jgi:hypothetical protein
MSDEPWPIANAIACLKEVRDREGKVRPGEEGDEKAQVHAETLRLGMDYAIEVVRSINSLNPPVEPSQEEILQRAMRGLCKELGTAFENFGLALKDFAESDYPAGWDPWDQKWEK